MKDKLTNYKPQRRNANRHTQRGLGALETSIQKDGWIGAITVAADGETFDGSARIEVGASTGFDDVIVVESDGTKPIVHKRIDIPTADDPRAVRLGYAANRVAALNLDFDPAIILADLDAGLDLSALWNEGELEAIAKEVGRTLAKGEGDDGAEQVDRAEELKLKWNTDTGQLWELGAHRLMCGNCTDAGAVEGLLGTDKADLLLTDPPYGINVVQGLRASVGGSKPVTIGAVRHRRPYPFGGVKNIRGSVGATNMVDATLYRPVQGDDKPFDPAHLLGVARNTILFGGNYFASKLPDSRCWIVWDKNNTGNFADAELAWTSFERSVRLYQFTWNGLVRQGERSVEGVKRFHPTQKPVGLFETILSDFSEANNIVVDLYLGSGTTLLACERQGRICRGMEIDPAYVAVTLQRWHDMTGREPRLLES